MMLSPFLYTKCSRPQHIYIYVFIAVFLWDMLHKVSCGSLLFDTKSATFGLWYDTARTIAAVIRSFVGCILVYFSA